ncbi:MAG TPA: hypothetical protein VGZ23_07325 [bacterium]|nr:hypothetical protein [bacterium]
MTLDSAGNQETVYASDTTAVAVESSSVPFCTLEGYVGAPAAASVVPYGNEFLATQIAVTGPVAVVPATTRRSYRCRSSVPSSVRSSSMGCCIF